jgi:hypothetical protein
VTLFNFNRKLANNFGTLLDIRRLESKEVVQSIVGVTRGNSEAFGCENFGQLSFRADNGQTTFAI